MDLNGTQAAIRAGYSAKTAQEQASRLLSNVMVQEALQKRQAQLCTKLEITQERVLEELAAIAFANGTDFVTVTETGLLNVKPTRKVPREKLPAIASIKYNQLGIEIKLHDKVRALELLGKHLGVFDNGAANAAVEENNIFAVIEKSTREEMGIRAIPEIEPPAKSGDDLVE